MRAAVLLTALTLSAHAQWTLQQSNTTADLRGIDNVGHGIAWASGSNGTVLHTTDNGATWLLCKTPPDAEHLDFRGIQAFDAKTAIVMSSGKGDLSRLYKTTDGCLTWKLVFRNPDKDGFWDSVRFQNEMTGTLLGDPTHGLFYVAESFDGGKHWRQINNKGLHADASGQGAFAASNSSLIASQRMNLALVSGGSNGAFYYADRETTICLDDCSPEESNQDGHLDKWSRDPVPVGTKSPSSGIFSVGFQGPDLIGDEKMQSWRQTGLSKEIGIAVGGDYQKPDDPTHTAAFTINGGKTWQAAVTPPHGYRSAVAYDASTKTWITVGPNGTDISTDDGRNWRALKPSPADQPDADQHWNALSLPFVVGPHGRIGLLNSTALQPAKSL